MFVTFDVLNFLCCFVGVVLLGLFCWCVMMYASSVVAQYCFCFVVNHCVMICECEGEVSLFLRVNIDVLNLRCEIWVWSS